MKDRKKNLIFFFMLSFSICYSQTDSAFIEEIRAVSKENEEKEAVIQQLKITNAEYSKKMDSLKTAYETTIREMIEKHEKAITDINEEHKKEIKKIIDEFNKRFDALRKESDRDNGLQILVFRNNDEAIYMSQSLNVSIKKLKIIIFNTDIDDNRTVIVQLIEIKSTTKVIKEMEGVLTRGTVTFNLSTMQKEKNISKQGEIILEEKLKDASYEIVLSISGRQKRVFGFSLK